MTRVTGTDHVLMLLQEQLAQLRKRRAQNRPAAARMATPAPMARVQALAAREGLSEDDVKRALVRGLLVEQLGEGLASDPAFEQVAADVMRIIGGTPEGRALLAGALDRLNA